MFKHIDLMTEQRRKEEEFQTKNVKYCEALLPRLMQHLQEKMKNLYLTSKPAFRVTLSSHGKLKIPLPPDDHY